MTTRLLPSDWRPVHAAGLVRVGPAADGGYVLRQRALEDSKHLSGGGVFDDWRFEEEFQARTGATVTCYDPTVSGTFWLKRYYAYARGLSRGIYKLSDFAVRQRYKRFFDGKKAVHRKLYIGYPGSHSISIPQMLEGRPSRSVFLKLDIEGGEYRVLDDIAANLDYLTGFVIEFHDVSVHRERISRFIASIAPEFEVAHVHINNYPGYAPDGLSIAIEMTFGRADDVAAERDTETTYPIPSLDFPCNPAVPDEPLEFRWEKQ